MKLVFFRCGYIMKHIRIRMNQVINKLDITPHFIFKDLPKGLYLPWWFQIE
jgi:hypothetical protein